MISRKLAKIIADSISPHGVRLTTMEIQLPRIVLAELNTHTIISKNSASSRAIPVEKMLARVIDDPYVPEQWDRNGSGMQGHGVVDHPSTIACCEAEWLAARDSAVEHTRKLLNLGIHKQTTNRLLEPFLWHTVIVTATEWSNFFNLRCHPAAHPALRNTAEAMRDAMQEHTPRKLEFGEWHLPLVDERDVNVRRADQVKLSVARCARVSYLTHDGVRDPQADIDLHDRLLAAGHLSPFQHVGRPMMPREVYVPKGMHVTSSVDVTEHFSGNFRGWVQYRKTIPGEFDILAHRKTTP
jgi:thymidylate synthase ThyX